MYGALRDEPSIKQRYQEIVRRITAIMKRDLCDMEPQSQEFSQHEIFVRQTHSYLTAFFRDLCPTDQFFSTNCAYPSNSYLDMFVATIRNYGLRLRTDRGKNELNHYFLAVLKNAAQEASLQEIPELLQEAMGNEPGPWTDLSQYILVVLTPSYIHAAFVSEPGWLLAEPLFEAAQEHLMATADCDRSGALSGARAIMSTIVNSIGLLMELHSPTNIRSSITYELVYMLLLSTKFMLLAFDWMPVTMELCKDHNEDIAACLSFFYHFACGARAYLRSPLQIFVNSLQRYHYPQDGQDDRKELAEAYEALGQSEERRNEALRRLTIPFARTAEDYPRVKATLKERHDRKFISGVWLFRDLADSGYFKEAKRCLKWELDAEGPEPSAIVLADLRKNWGNFPGNGDYEIRIGQAKGIAPGLLSNGKSIKGFFEKLMKALDEYIVRFERQCGSREERVRGERRRAIDQSEDLIF
jgi:hypothetical protein